MKKALIFSILLLYAASAAAVPGHINIQGQLTDSANKAITGTLPFSFKVYDSADNLLWEEEKTVTVTNGFFSSVLGDTAGVSLPFDKDYFLEVAVNGETLSPRSKLGSVPYAFTALQVLGDDNIFPETGDVGIGTAAPQSKLHVVGEAIASAITLNGIGLPAAANLMQIIGANGAGDFLISLSNGLQEYAIKFRDSDDSLAIISESGKGIIIGPTGTVGIGTKTPGTDYLLDIDSGSSGALRVKGTGIIGKGTNTVVDIIAGEYPNALSVVADSGRAVMAIAKTGTALYAYSESKGLIVESGKVGIGAINPSEQLEVNGNIKANGNIKITGIGNELVFPDGTTQTTAAAGSSGLSCSVVAASESSGSNGKVVAQCGAGKIAVGGGGSCPTGNTAYTLQISCPASGSAKSCITSGTPSSWYVYCAAVNEPGTSAYAICC